MKLEQCTKAELLQIIDKYLFGWQIEAMLLKFEMDRINIQHIKTSELLKRADECVSHREEILQPYRGKQFKDIPTKVLKKADALADEAYNCHIRAARMCGVKLKGGE